VFNVPGDATVNLDGEQPCYCVLSNPATAFYGREGEARGRPSATSPVTVPPALRSRLFSPSVASIFSVAAGLARRRASTRMACSASSACAFAR
jgi:hypothetical protein